MDLIVEAENVEKSFGALKVLKGVSLHVQQAEIVCIMGSSGAGKSTFLNLLGTLESPDSGTIKIRNQDIGKLKGQKLDSFRNKEIGFVFQFHHLLPEFTALENVCMPAWIGGAKEKDARQRGMELLDFFHLSNRSTHFPTQLSGGEQQRIAVARALINKPSIVLADEPSGNLDSKNADELHRLFVNLRDQFHQTFIIVTHNPALAELADKVCVMSDGQFQA